MEPDATQVVAGSGLLYVAPLGTALPPLDVLSGEFPVVWPAGWNPVGYTDDGIDMTYTPTVKDINVDEEMAPVAKLLTAEKLAVQAKLAEATLQNLNRAISASSYTDDSAPCILTLTGVAVGVAAVYSYSAFTGPAPLVGRSVVITGFVTGGNNVTGLITAVDLVAKTITLATTTQVNEVHAAVGTIASRNAIVFAAGSGTLNYVMVGIQAPAPGTNKQRIIIVFKCVCQAAVSMKMQRKDKVVIPVTFEAVADSTQPAGQRLVKIVDLSANAA